MQRFRVVVLLVSILVFISCSPRIVSSTVIQPAAGDVSRPDFHDLRYWAAHPWKADPSDSVPLPLQRAYQYDSTVDVFFLHPTTYTSKQATGWNANINDTALNNKTDNSTILLQASVFNEFRIFAPRYRQVHIRSYFTNEPEAKAAFEIAYQDIRNAFLQYLMNYNEGRPIIIASHSQGSTHAQLLLKEFFDTSVLKEKLVAAYVIGMGINGEQFQTLKMCTDSAQTGCLIGWRSYRAGYEPEFVENEKGRPMVTNPLSWTIDETPASRQQNTGSILRNFNKLVVSVADATVHNRVLWISELRFPGSLFVKMKNLHIGDINLFYVNIRENLQTRVKSFRNE